jgi:3-dehydroquinate dehydratase
VELAALHQPTTETVELNPLRSNRAQARALITRLADIFELRIDSIEERRKWISTEFRVTLTGDPFNIGNFREATSGREPADPDERWFDLAFRVAAAAGRAAIERLHW